MPKGVYKHKPNQKFQKGHKFSKEIIEKMRNKKKGIMPKNLYWLQHSPKINGKRSITQKRNWKNGKLKIYKGENHPSWKGGISFEPYSIDWTETLRRSIRERDHYTCQLCLEYGNTVHHIDYDKKNCNPNNLITLCSRHNAKVNSNRNYWTNYFNIALSPLIL